MVLRKAYGSCHFHAISCFSYLCPLKTVLSLAHFGPSKRLSEHFASRNQTIKTTKIVEKKPNVDYVLYNFTGAYRSESIASAVISISKQSQSRNLYRQNNRPIRITLFSLFLCKAQHECIN